MARDYETKWSTKLGLVVEWLLRDSCEVCSDCKVCSDCEVCSDCKVCSESLRTIIYLYMHAHLYTWMSHVGIRDQFLGSPRDLMMPPGLVARACTSEPSCWPMKYVRISTTQTYNMPMQGKHASLLGKHCILPTLSPLKFLSFSS